MFRLVYCSEADKQVTPELVAHILEKAKSNNSHRDISGILFYSPKYFLQCLEGDAEAVNQIYHKISLDARHKNLQIISAHDCTERLFGEWAMGVASHKKENQNIYFKYLPHKELNPYKLTSENATQLLSALSKVATTF